MPLQSTSGAASYDAFGGGVAAVPKYIEDYFSTYLVTGDGTAPAVNNGIDLSTKGGLVWIKKRSAAGSNDVFDTARGANLRLITNDTAAQDSKNLSFTTTGFSNYTLDSSVTYASWSWAKAPKFFDVVTYTGNGSGNRIITSSLGSPIGCVFIKRTDSTSNWATAHRKDGSAVATGLSLNTTAAALYPNSTNDTFDATGGFNAGYIVDSTGDGVNVNGATYVAYLFAHNAGGFGLTGTDNVISCGSFTTDGSGNFSVNLGYEPQWVMIKSTNNTGVSAAQQNWIMMDSMRGLVTQSGNGARLRANTSEAESTTNDFGPTATGFESLGNMSASAPFIYIAIRRGPMKVPTSGTSVYNNLANRVGTSATATISGVGFPVDLMLPFNETSGSVKPFVDRLRGATKYLLPPYSNAEQTETNVVTSFASNDGVIVGADSLDVINNYYNASRRYAASFFRRAPSVFDIVCYTGTGSARTVTHNLGVAPEMMIVKERSGTGDWWVYNKSLGSGSPQTKALYLSFTDAEATVGVWNNTAPTSSVFSVSSSSAANGSGLTYVAYLFATCAGVSKVGNYTGTGALQTVNCGFTSGARFILIKRTDSTGNWYLYDSARGITSGNDPYLLLNTTGTSELGTNYVDTDSTGFKVTAAAPAELNANGGNFIFLAIS